MLPYLRLGVVKTYVLNARGSTCRALHVLCKFLYSSSVGHQGWKCNKPFDWMTPGDLQWMSGMM